MLINVLERDLAAANRAYCSLPHARKAPPPPTEWDLGQLIDVAASLKRIPDTTRNPSHAVRGFRSLVHPGRQVRTGQQASQQEAVISVQVIEICLGTLI